MKDETAVWLDYAHENLESARILLKSRLFNACLQNIQQCVEKSLKAVIVDHTANLIKTHSILRLKQMLTASAICVPLTDEECDLLDTLYLPSKYPIGSAISDYNPDEEICEVCLKIACRIDGWVKNFLKED
jgi:HEPN domain-containing protein